MIEVLDRSSVIIDVEEKEKEAILLLMAEQLNKLNRIDNVENFMQDVLARESLEPTAIGHMIGMPHGRSRTVTFPSICFARLFEPMIWNDKTGEEVDTVIMIAVPDDDNETHIKIISKLARNLMHDEFRQNLSQSTTEEIYQIFKNILAGE